MVVPRESINKGGNTYKVTTLFRFFLSTSWTHNPGAGEVDGGRVDADCWAREGYIGKPTLKSTECIHTVHDFGIRHVCSLSVDILALPAFTRPFKVYPFIGRHIPLLTRKLKVIGGHTVTNICLMIVPAI